MANVTKTNTKIFKSADGSWVRVVYDTGNKDADGNAITIEKTITTASLEKQAGVLLPKARIKAILEAELAGKEAPSEVELTAAL